jgi:hypothetical protein
MRRKTPSELTRALLAKTIRQHVRLKHSLAADEEINEVLPLWLDKFDRALAEGKPFNFDTNELP